MPVRTDSTTKDIGRLFFRSVFCYHGMPTTIVSDRGPRWLSAFWTSFYKHVGTTLAVSTSFHPQIDGQTERANRTVRDMLRSFANKRHDDWDELLPAVEFAYNYSVQRSTRKTPFYLAYGRHPRTPAALMVEEGRPQLPRTDNPEMDAFVSTLQDALEQAKEAIAGAQGRQKEFANRHRCDVSFKAGDLLLCV